MLVNTHFTGTPSPLSGYMFWRFWKTSGGWDSPLKPPKMHMFACIALSQKVTTRTSVSVKLVITCTVDNPMRYQDSQQNMAKIWKGQHSNSSATEAYISPPTRNVDPTPHHISLKRQLGSQMWKIGNKNSLRNLTPQPKAADIKVTSFARTSGYMLLHVHFPGTPSLLSGSMLWRFWKTSWGLHSPLKPPKNAPVACIALSQKVTTKTSKSK